MNSRIVWFVNRELMKHKNVVVQLTLSRITFTGQPYIMAAILKAE